MKKTTKVMIVVAGAAAAIGATMWYMKRKQGEQPVPSVADLPTFAPPKEPLIKGETVTPVVPKAVQDILKEIQDPAPAPAVTPPIVREPEPLIVTTPLQNTIQSVLSRTLQIKPTLTRTSLTGLLL